MDLNLTDEEWEALADMADRQECATGDCGLYLTALDKVLAHRPKPVLEDGKYLTPVGSLVFVAGGRYFHNAFDLGGGGNPLPDDVSGWTRLRVLADDEVAVKLDGYFVAPDGYGDPAIWREREGKDPVPVLYRHYATGALFDALAAALPHRDDR